MVNRDMSGYGSMNRGLVIYSVINADGRLSEVPTKNYFDSDTAGSVLLNTVDLQGGYINSAKNRIYLYAYGTELDTSSQPDASAFTIADGSGNSYTNVSVQVVNKNVTTNRTSGYVILSLSEALSTTDIYVSYKVPETGAIQDTTGNKVQAFDSKPVSTANKETSAVISDDQKYMNITIPLSDIHTNFTDVQVWVDNAVIPANQMRWSMSVNQMTAYVKLTTSAVSGSSVVVKAAEGKKLYNAAEDEIESLKIDIDTEESISFANSFYSSEENKLYIEVNGVKGARYPKDLYACDFVVQVAGKEYRLRGRASWQKIEEKRRIVFNEYCWKHIPGPGSGSFQIKYSPLLPQEGHNSPYASGKPMVATEYMDVDIQ